MHINSSFSISVLPDIYSGRPAVQMRKLKHREMKQLLQAHKDKDILEPGFESKIHGKKASFYQDAVPITEIWMQKW